MASYTPIKHTTPVGPLQLAVMESSRSVGEQVDRYLTQIRRERLHKGHHARQEMIEYNEDSYLLDCHCPRFGTGEGKGYITQSVRGCDLFILTDVTNSSLTYRMNGQDNRMSPDDHYQDLKRIIEAANGKAKRINVIIPFLYEGRQHRRTMRESLDCAVMLQELVHMGVTNIITFDAHDPRMQNAIPLNGFDSFIPAYQFLKSMVSCIPDFRIDKNHMMVISPDEGAMERSIYLANILGVSMGVFYKRRDYTRVVNGKNPIVAHEFLGESVEGKDVLVIDDIISSGESMLDVATQLHRRGARNVFVASTFGLFTDGLEKFDRFHEEGIISKVITTNLTYRSQELLSRDWYVEADLTEYLALIIDTINHDDSIAGLQMPTEKIHELMDNLRQR